MLDDRGAINGEQINFFEVDGGAFVLDIEAAHAFAFNQTAELSRQREMVAAHAFAVTQTLQLGRVRELATAHSFAFTQGADVWRLIELAFDDQIIFDQFIVLDVVPAITIAMDFAFDQTADVEHLHFNKWRDGYRIPVPEDPRTLRVRAEHRRIIVPPDRDVLVRQKDRELVV